MKTHRIRSAKSTDRTKRPHVFVELEENRWLEVMPIISHVAIHRFLEKEKTDKWLNITFADRAFHIGIIKNWANAGYVV